MSADMESEKVASPYAHELPPAGVKIDDPGNDPPMTDPPPAKVPIDDPRPPEPPREEPPPERNDPLEPPPIIRDPPAPDANPIIDPRIFLASAAQRGE